MEGGGDTGLSELDPGSGEKVWQDFFIATECDLAAFVIAPQTRERLLERGGRGMGQTLKGGSKEGLWGRPLGHGRGNWAVTETLPGPPHTPLVYLILNAAFI